MTTNATSQPAPSPFALLSDLRTVLRVDAVVTGANGIAYLALAAPLADLFGIPAGFLRGVGVFLALFAVAVWTIAAQRRVSRAAAAAVALANVVWVAASIGSAIGDLHGMTTEATVWTCAQALVVAGLAVLQARALRAAAV